LILESVYEIVRRELVGRIGEIAEKIADCVVVLAVREAAQHRSNGRVFRLRAIAQRLREVIAR
jgi:hypothetical protein